MYWTYLDALSATMKKITASRKYINVKSAKRTDFN